MDRVGLYIMVFVILINTCAIYKNTNRMERLLTKINVELGIEDKDIEKDKHE